MPRCVRKNTQTNIFTIRAAEANGILTSSSLALTVSSVGLVRSNRGR